MPGLDVLRGVAIGLVLLRHSFPDAFAGAGMVGVVTFFALSGFLITGVLDQDLRRNGRISYATFYVHRAFRLLPALVAMLTAFCLVGLIADRFGGAGTVVSSTAAGLLYVADLPLPVDLAGPVTTLWTLAIEEQFYLVWPFLLALAFARGRTGRMVIGAVVVLEVLCVIGASAFSDDLEVVYPLPTTWAATLVMGAAAYLYRERIGTVVGAGARRSWVLGTAAAAVLAGLSVVPDAKHHAWFYVLGGPTIAVAAAVLIFIARQWTTVPRVLAPLRWLGLISYATYLWNVLVQQLIEATAPHLTMVLTIPATIAVATVSWFTVEWWGRIQRRRYDQRRRARQRVAAVEPV
jgi:peptidoglycan/LPS O-acetylase OafA/YrhL